MSQLACEENEGKISGALVMSGMIGNPYEKTRLWQQSTFSYFGQQTEKI